ncbi:hypothetical protein [Ornithinimicrobium cryptoxanthini]|nr:hypothetical protein [Ornithinimicrobium cryptoxanthini]
MCVVGVVWSLVNDGDTWITVALAVLAVVAVINLVVVARRKARGEPG